MGGPWQSGQSPQLTTIFGGAQNGSESNGVYQTPDSGRQSYPGSITVYADRSFSFITKTPPAAVLIKKAVGIESGSGVPNKTKVASITKKQLEEIASTKMPDLNAANLETAISMIAGTCRSMGVTVTD